MSRSVVRHVRLRCYIPWVQKTQWLFRRHFAVQRIAGLMGRMANIASAYSLTPRAKLFRGLFERGFSFPLPFLADRKLHQYRALAGCVQAR